jgi:AcrR family transcriptional regulator
VILDAATGVLSQKVDASIEDIAFAAGVSRQTVYAHYPSRQALLNAVVERAASDVIATIDAAGLDDLTPGVGLLRFLEIAWQTSARYPFLWYLPPVSEDQDVNRHGPALDRMRELISRAQQCGDIDTDLSPAWLLTASLALGRSAETEVKEGRMTAAEATQNMINSMTRLLGLRSDNPT